MTALPKRLIATLLATLSVAGVALVHAQEFPSRPVKLIVPYAAGGVPDVIARTYGQRMSESTGQNFVVENRGGGGGIAAVVAVATSPADGYTLLVADLSQSAINPHLFAKLPYDTMRDLTPVTNLSNSYIFVVAGASAPFNTFAEMVTYARANPGKISYGSSGIGSLHHLSMEAAKSGLKLDLVHVPYKGAGQSVPAFLSGETQVVMASLPALVSHIRAGKARLLAVNSGQRSPLAPEVPSLAEFVPGLDFTTDIGLFGPAGLPPAVVNKLYQEAAKAAKLPDTVQKLNAVGLVPVGNPPAEYAAQVRRNIERMGPVVKASGAVVN
jgi:tripartite-type tricarboxylate transporter receptor subunit TctC